MKSFELIENKNGENSINKEAGLVYIEKMFLFSLKHKSIIQKQSLFEHLSLKYISFLAKYRNNPVKAYYQLKSLMSQHNSQISLYFECIQSIISEKIEQMIKINQENKQKENKDNLYQYQNQQEEDQNKLMLEDFIFSDNFKTHMIPLISEFISRKVKLYESMRKGYDRLIQFGDEIVKLSKLATTITSQMKISLGNDLSFNSQTNQSKKTSQNIYILKILSLYEGIVLNKFEQSLKYEELILDMKKRDYLLNLSVINTLNILKGNMQTVLISLSSNRGKILNKNQKKVNSFFGYNHSNDQNLYQVGQLMPPFLSEIHDNLIENYIKRGYSPVIKQSTYSYGQDVNGFIIPLSISFENIFDIKDDFCMYASLLKLENAKEFFVFNSKGQILGFTESIYNDVFQYNSENSLFTAKKTLDAFDVKQKLSFFMIMPDIIQIIQNQETKKDTKDSVEKQTLNHKIDTILQNQVGIIKIPQNLLELHQQYKSNQYFSIEKSKGASSHHSLNQSQTKFSDALDNIELYQNFYNQNLSDWNKENLLSETKIKYNLVKQQLSCSKDNKETNTIFYTIEISEQTSLMNRLNRRDSFDLSPKVKRKKGDILQPNKNNTDKKLSFYEVLKLATNQNRLQKQASRQNSIVSSIDNKEVFSHIPSNQRNIQSDIDIDQQSNSSLSKHINQISLFSPGLRQRDNDKKSHRIISNFSQFSDRNQAQSPQNNGIIEKSLSILPQETDIMSNQKIEISSRVDDNNLLIKKHQILNNSNIEKFNPIKRLLGPQFSKNNQPALKSYSKEFEPQFSMDEAQRSENDKIKIKNLHEIYYQNSIVSSSFAKSPPTKSPQEQLSLWQRIKNKVTTQTKRQSLLKGITLFLRDRQEQNMDEKIEKVIPKPDTISNNSAIDMDNEIEFQDSSNGKKGTTILRKNAKSTHHTKTNNQMRSTSHLSSRSSNNIGQQLFSNIAYSHHKPRIFFKLKLFFCKIIFYQQITQIYFLLILFQYQQIGLFIIVFGALQIGLSLGIVSKFETLNEGLHFNQILLEDNSEFSMQALNSINYYLIQSGQLDPKYLPPLYLQMNDLSKKYEANFVSHLQNYLKYQDEKVKNLQISIFSQKVEQKEIKQLVEYKFYNLNSMTQILTTNKNKINTDQFFYLVKNYNMNQQVDKEIINKIYDDYMDQEDYLILKVNIFIGIYLVSFVLFIFCFIPFLKAINQYQKRVLVLIARISEAECINESTKLTEFLKYIIHKNETWISKHFILIDQQNNQFDSTDKQSKQFNLTKTQKMPIQSKIKIQHISSFKQVLLFIFISLFGLSYFAIFIFIIKNYSQETIKYLDFFKFSQLAIPNFNTMIVDWSLIITSKQFQGYTKEYPLIDMTDLKKEFKDSQLFVKQYLIQFSQEVDKLSRIGHSITHSNAKQIFKLYTENICEYYNSTSFCNDLSIQIKQIYKAGLAELISRYLQFLISYNALVEDNIDKIIKQKIFIEYLNSIEYIDLILNKYNNTLKFLNEIIRLNIDSFDKFYQQLQKTHILYFCLYGSFVSFLFITVGLLLYQKSLIRLNHINFGLTCLPYSKISEEATLQMLKYIKQI